MFNASDLSADHQSAIESWAAEGAQLSDIQKRMKEELGLNVTYMDVRFMVLDLGIEIKSEDEAEPEKEEEKPALVPQGFVTVDVDEIVRAGALVSGRATFTDGENAVWMVDQMGRLSLDPDTAGYRPSEEDMKEFQQLLRDKLQR